LNKSPAKAKVSQIRRRLFDREKFSASLSERNSHITSFKEAVQNARDVLDERFRSKAPIEEIILDQAWFTDQLLVYAWDLYDWNDAQDISLIAVGGYGRGELHPYSDIDIQILLEKDNKNKYQENIEMFLTFLWDINLEIGQSVRSIKENWQEAAKDITVATALIESRTLTGNPALLETVKTLIDEKKNLEAQGFL